MENSELYLKYWQHLPSKKDSRIEKIKHVIASTFEKLNTDSKKEVPKLFELLLNVEENHKKIKTLLPKLEILPDIDGVSAFEFLSLSRNQPIIKEEIFILMNEKFPKQNNVAIFNYQEEIKNPFLLSLSKYGNTIMDGTEIYFNKQDDLSNCVSIPQVLKVLFPNIGKKSQKIVLNLVQKNNLVFLTVLHTIFSVSEKLKNQDFFNQWIESFDPKNSKKYDLFFKITNYFPDMEEERFLKLLEEVPVNANQIAIKDTYYQLFFIMEKCSFKGLEINDKKYNSIRKLHDAISALYLKFVKNNENVQLFLTERFIGLSLIKNSTFEYGNKKYKIVIPDDSHTLVEWGEKMSNCIASYSDSAANGECILIGLEGEDGEIKYNAEWTDGELVQMVEFADKPASNAICEAFTRFMQRANIRENYLFNPNQVKINNKKDEIKNDGPVYLSDKINKSVNQDLNNLIEGFPFGVFIELDHYDITYILSNFNKICPQNLETIVFDDKVRSTHTYPTTVINPNDFAQVTETVKNTLINKNACILINLSNAKNNKNITELLFSIRTLVKNTESVIFLVHDFQNNCFDLNIRNDLPSAISAIRMQSEISLGFEKSFNKLKIVVKKYRKELKNRIVNF